MEKYRHSPSWGFRHVKWDKKGLGDHDAYCSRCRRIVHWIATGEMSDA